MGTKKLCNSLHQAKRLVGSILDTAVDQGEGVHTGAPNLLASLGHSGRRRVVLGYT